MKYQVVMCICWKGEPLSVSINNPRNQTRLQVYDTREQAERRVREHREHEASRIELERKEPSSWNGNEFVFWSEAVKEADDATLPP